MTRVKVSDPECLLVLKGTGPQEKALRSLVRDLDLGENVIIMTDRLDQGDMAKLYNCADLLTVASRTDLFPFTAIEAISCGVPVATSFARGLKSDIVDAGAGAMISPEPPRMASDLLCLLEDPVRLDLLGSKARELALKDFSYEVGADRLASIYSEGME